MPESQIIHPKKTFADYLAEKSVGIILTLLTAFLIVAGASLMKLNQMQVSMQYMGEQVQHLVEADLGRSSILTRIDRLEQDVIRLEGRLMKYEGAQ